MEQKPIAGGATMYQEYRITELVTETLTTVIDNVQSNHDKKSSKKKPKRLSSIDEMNEYEQLSRDLEEEYIKSLQIMEDEFEPARTHWIQLQKSNKQGLAIRSCFLVLLDKYPHVRPIWAFSKKTDDDNWKPDLNEDFYFRHHCASIQAALNMIIQTKDDRNSLRRMLNEMGGHHFFYDACEPHLEIFQECFLEAMKLVLNGGDALDDEIERSWILLLQTIRVHMSEGIEIQRINYLSQCLIPKEMEEIREQWKMVQEFGIERAGSILCETACQKYVELLRKHNLKMKLPAAAEKGSPSYHQLSIQLMKAINKTIESYSNEQGFCRLVDEIRDFVIKFLVVDVCPPLIRRSFLDGLVEMLCKVLKIKHVKEDFVHIWNKLYRVMEQAMIANIVDY